MSQTIHHQMVVVGGGTAGISVAARLTIPFNPCAVLISDTEQ